MNTISLEDIRIASPCPASWDKMTGNDRVRFCGECRLNVYNLSAMPRAEAERLIRERDGRLCVQIYRRKDGTVLTKDCPVGLLALARRRVPVLIAGIFALLGTVLLGAHALETKSPTDGERTTILQRWFGRLPAYRPPKPEPTEILKGEMVAPQYIRGRVNLNR